MKTWPLSVPVSLRNAALAAFLLVFLPLVVLAQATPDQSSQNPQRPHAILSILPEARVHGAPDDSAMISTKGSVHPSARPEFDKGAVANEMPLEHMKLVLKRSPEQEAALQEFFKQVQDPDHPNFHRWLTPDEFGAHFGPAESDIAAVKGWLESHGMKVTGVARGRQTLEFSATAGQVSAAFQTPLHRFVVNGEEHFANSAPVRIPAALAPVVGGVASLNNFFPRPMIEVNGFYGYIYDALDIRAMYNVPSNATGAGVRIGLPEPTDPVGGLINHGHGNYSVQDYDDYNTLQNLPTNLTVLLPYGDPGGGDGETTLDMQVAHGMAPQAQIVLVPSPDSGGSWGGDLAQDYLVDNDLVDIISLSFAITDGGPGSFDDYVVARGEQAAAEGISYFVGSGDWGSGTPAGSDPNVYGTPTLGASLYTAHPYVTSVGGTISDTGSNALYWWGLNGFYAATVASFQTTSVGGHIPEDGWNGSGGGYDATFPQPEWQVGVPGITPGLGRAFPDVSLIASGDSAYFICQGGSCAGGNPLDPHFTMQSAGGTSASGPAFAAIVALIDQKYGRQGLVNPTLYKLASGENWSDCNGSSQSKTRPPSSCVFYDITNGSNAVGGQPGYGTSSETYDAGTGYDLVTGLGSVNVAELINKWTSIHYVGTTTTLTLGSNTETFGTPINISGTVTDNTSAGTPTGFVTLLDNHNHSYGPYALDAGGNFSGTMTGVTIGANTIKALYGGDTQYAKSTSASQSLQTTKINSSLTVLWQNPDGSTAPASAPYGAGTYTIVVNANGTTGYGNPSGNVVINYTRASTGSTQYYLGTTPLTSLTPASGSSMSIPNWLSNNVPVDTYTLTATYAGDDTFNPSPAATGAITITKAVPTVAVSLSTNSSTLGSAVDLIASVSVPQTVTAPSGTVQFYQNGNPVGSPVAVGSASISGGAYNLSAKLTTTGLYPGNDSVTAVYSGDAITASSTSAAQNITVHGFTDTVSVAANHTSNVFQGLLITLTATVTSQRTSPALTGNVQFMANGISLGTAPITSSTIGGYQAGTATLQTTALPVGADTITANYLGDANYNPQNSFGLPITILPSTPKGATNVDTLNFPTTIIGASAPVQGVSLENIGTSNLIVGTPTISGPAASSFSVTTTCPAGSQINPFGTFCSYSVTFAPQAAGTLSAQLAIPGNAPNSPNTVSLTGTGIPAGPDPQLSATTINFGSQVLNTASAAQTVKVTNIGSTAVTGLSVSSPAAPFSVDASSCAATLASQASCSILVTFTPTADGAASSQFQVSYTGGSQAVALSGTGINAQSISFLSSLHPVPATITTPGGVASDTNGNVFISDSANNAVYEVDPEGVQTTLPINGLTAPGAMTIGPDGALYVVSNGGRNNVSVIRYVSPSNQVSTLFSGAYSATGVAVDSNGKIYITDPSISTAWERGPGETSSTQIPFSQLGVLEVNAIAIDSNNNLYVSGTTGSVNVVNEKVNITGTPTTIATGLTNPVALAIGRGNSLYVSDATDNTVTQYANGFAYRILQTPALNGAGAIFVDSQTRVYVVSTGSAKVFLASSAQPLNAGQAAVGTPQNFNVTLSVPVGNSVSAISVADSAGNSEWTLPNGNTCTVSNNRCSFDVSFNPAFPGQRDATLQATDALGHTVTLPIYGIGTGPEAAFFLGNKSTVSGTWTPTVLHSDSAGNVFLLDQTNPAGPAIQKITPAGAVSTALDTSTVPGGAEHDFAMDAQGNFYLKPVSYASAIYRVSSSGSGLAINGISADGPLARDAAGDYYDTASNTLATFDVYGNFVNAYTYGTASNVNIQSVAVDEFQNIYVATDEPAIYKTSYLGVTTTLLDSTTAPGGYQLTTPTQLAVDAAGTVYVADAGANALFRIPSGGTPTSLPLGIANPSFLGVAVTPQGSIYISDEANSALYRMDAANFSMAFGDIADQTSSAVQSVQLANAGNRPLAFSALSVPAAYQQQQDGNACSASSTLSAGANCSLTFLFNPTTLGEQDLSATATTNSLNAAGTQTVSFTGNSIVGAPAQLVFVTPPPSSINANASFGHIQVQVEDAAGNPISNSTDGARLIITGPEFPSGLNGGGGPFSSGVADLNLSSFSISQAGTYTFTVNDPNATSVPAISSTVTVNPLSQTITFGSLSDQTYGITPFNLGASATSNLPISYSVTGPATISGSTLSVIGAGLVTVTASQAGNSTWSPATSVVRSFNVAKALLTVKAKDVSMFVNEQLPTLTYSISGYVNGDAVEFPVVSGAPALSAAVTLSSTTPQVVTSPAGNYTISGTQGTLAAANYNFQFATGTLFVTQPGTPASLPIAWLPPAAISYGTPLDATQLNASTVTTGTFLYMPAAGAVLDAGTQSLSVQFTPTDTTDFATATASVPLTVTQATPLVALGAAGNPIPAGSSTTFKATVSAVGSGAAPTGTVTFTLNSYTGPTVLGTVNLTGGSASIASGTLPAGSYTVSAVYNGNTDYTTATSNTLAQFAVPQVNVGASTTFLVPVTPTSSGTVSSIVVLNQGAATTEFAVVPGGTCSATAYSAVAGTTCTVNIQFTPTVSGNHNAGLELLTGASPATLAGAAYLRGLAIGPQTNFLPGSASNPVSGFNFPEGVAVDGAGNLFVADTYNNQIVLETNTGTGYSASTLGSGFAQPNAVAVDALGNVIVADTFNNQIVLETQTSPGTWTQSVLTTSALSEPYGVAVDPAGNIYIADTYNNRILIETLTKPGSTTYTEAVIPTSSLAEPQGVAVDAAGNVYIADTYNNRILMEAPSAGTYTESVVAAFPTSFNALLPISVAVDSNGRIYFTSGPTNALVRETPAGANYTETVLPTAPLSSPGAISVDGAGNVYLADTNHGAIVEMDYADLPTLAFTNATPKGSADTSENPKRFTVENFGNAPLSISAIAFPTDFPKASAASDCRTTATLPAGSTCTLSVTFKPVSSSPSAALTELVRLTDNNLNQSGVQQKLTVTGIEAPMATVALSLSASKAIVGTSVTFTALVNGNGPAVTGSVSFYSDASLLASVALTGNQASFSTGALPVGTHAIVATYSGDANYPTATSIAHTQSIVATPTLAIAAVPNPVAVGNLLTLQATVGGSSPTVTPTGTVSFYDLHTLIARVPLVSGVASVPNVALVGGAHSIAAVYNGDSNYATVRGALTVHVTKMNPTAITLGASANPVTVGTTVTLTATIAGAGSTPTGTVILRDLNAQIGTATLNAGTATFVISNLAAARHYLSIQYRGDDYYAAANSTVLSLLVNKLTASAVVTANPNPATLGAPVVLTATLSSTGPAPTGTVKFLDGSTTLGQGVLANGVATLNTSSLLLGTNPITISYSGDANYDGSRNLGAVNVTVSR